MPDQVPGNPEIVFVVVDLAVGAYGIAEVSHWSLVISHWLLVTGHWSLVIGQCF